MEEVSWSDSIDRVMRATVTHRESEDRHAEHEIRLLFGLVESFTIAERASFNGREEVSQVVWSVVRTRDASWVTCDGFPITHHS